MDITKLDAFRWCRCLRHAGKVMLLVVLALAGCVYYAVMATVLVPGLQSPAAGVQVASALGTAAYTAVVAMLLWCYFATFLTEPGHVPAGWTPFGDEEEGLLASGQPLELLLEQHARWAAQQGGRAYLERPRFCSKCQAWKPPRAHHDSVTGRCVLRMDHYCVWMLNCVGLLNYKHFVLFLGYGCLACTISALLLIRPCIDFFSSLNPPLRDLIMAFIAFVFSTAFSLALLGFTIMHLRLIALNQTTIEAYEKRPIRPWPYDRGWRQNFQEVFGRRRALWLLPRHTRAARRAMLESHLAHKISFVPLTALNMHDGSQQHSNGTGVAWSEVDVSHAP